MKHATSILLSFMFCVCFSAFAQVEVSIKREYSDTFAGTLGQQLDPDLPTVDLLYKGCARRYINERSASQVFQYSFGGAGTYQISSNVYANNVTPSPSSANVYNVSVPQSTICSVNPQTSTDTNMFRGAVDTGWSTVVTAVGQFVAIGGSPLNDSYYQFTSTNAIVKLSGTGNFCGGALAPQTVTSSAQSFLEGLWQLCASGSWDYLPGASAGSRGTPILQAKGTFKSNQPIEFRVTNAPKDGTLFFMYSITAANLPLYGATLVPDITAPGSGILPLTADAKGEIKLPLTLPPGIPAGIKFYFQVWTLDSSGPNGYTATHGLVALSQ